MSKHSEYCSGCNYDSAEFSHEMCAKCVLVPSCHTGKTYQYAVTVVYSEDSSVSTTLFPSFDEATEYLENAVEEEFRIDVTENEWECERYISKDKMYAKITICYDDGSDDIGLVEYYVSTV